MWHRRPERIAAMRWWQRWRSCADLALTADGRCLAGDGTTVASHASLSEWCAAHPGTRARLWICSSRQLCWNADDRLPLRSLQACADAARAQLTQVHGPAAEAWPLAPWRTRHGAGALALQGLDGDRLVSLAADHDIRWRQLAPGWTAAWAVACALQPAMILGQAALAWVEATGLTLIRANDGHWRQVQMRPLREPTVDALRGTLSILGQPMDDRLWLAGWGLTGERAGLGSACVLGNPGADAGQAWGWLCHSLSDAGLRAASACVNWRLREPAPRGRKLAAGAAGTLAAAAWGWSQSPSPPEVATVAVVEATARRASPVSAVPVVRGKVWGAQHWQQALQSLEKTPQGVAWTAVEVDAAQGSALLSGQAERLQQLKQAMGALQLQPPWNDARLRHWSGLESGHRFELELSSAARLVQPPAAGASAPHATLAPVLQRAEAAGLQVQRAQLDEGGRVMVTAQGSFALLRPWLQASSGPQLLRLRLSRAGTQAVQVEAEAQWRPAPMDAPAGTPPDPVPARWVAAWGSPLPAATADAPALAAQAPAVPVVPAPPFPYELIGQIDDGTGRRALLSGPLRSLAVRAGDVIDGQWRVDQIQPQLLTLQWTAGTHVLTLGYRP